jgi:hypothetical protein
MTIMHLEIREQLLQLKGIDQAVREDAPEVLAMEQSSYWDAVTIANAKTLAQIISKIGWPTPAKVGEEAALGAWLIALHADHDVEFQKLCLRHMEDQFPDDISDQDIAFIYDRICVNEGRGQFFGTQFWENEYGAYGPEPIFLPELVDERRFMIGLPPIAEYKRGLQEKYGITH